MPELLGTEAASQTATTSHGRLRPEAGKQQDKGGIKFVDPLEIIKAWGFKMAPGLKVTNEG